MSDSPNADGPVGQGDWIVEEGDSIDSIAYQTGHFWQTLWTLPANAELKAARANRTVLRIGDRVTVPDLRAKQESRKTDLVHRFVRKGVPAEMAFVVRDHSGAALAGRPYRLRVGSRLYQGQTDQDGGLRHAVIPIASQARLEIESGRADKPPLSWTISIGRLHPPETILGLQQRLANLGYFTARQDGAISDRLKDAIRLFQASQGMPLDGAMTEDLVKAVDRIHGQ